MSSLISDAAKAAYQSVMDDIHDTFKRPLLVFKDGTQVILSTNPTYSHIYKQPLGNVERATVQREILARIYYFRRIGNKLVPIVAGDATLTQQPADEIRLKISPTDFDFIKDAPRFIVDGNPYEKNSPANPNGLFGTGFYTLFLRRVS